MNRDVYRIVGGESVEMRIFVGGARMPVKTESFQNPRDEYRRFTLLDKYEDRRGTD